MERDTNLLADLSDADSPAISQRELADFEDEFAGIQLEENRHDSLENAVDE